MHTRKKSRAEKKRKEKKRKEKKRKEAARRTSEGDAVSITPRGVGRSTYTGPRPCPTAMPHTSSVAFSVALQYGAAPICVTATNFDKLDRLRISFQLKLRFHRFV